MSNYPAIPEPNLEPEGLLFAVQALKQAVEMLTGQRNGVGQALTSDDQPDLHSVAETGDYEQLHNLPDLFSGAFADLTGKPTTRSGYGITDAEAYGEYNGIVTDTSSRTLALTDKGQVCEMNSGSAQTYTVPPNASVAFPTKSRVDIVRHGAGELSIVAGSGVTINSQDAKLRLNKQFSGATLYKRGTNEWTLIGDLKT